MIKNYLLTTFRNLWRNKVYAFVSISGLAIGVSCTILIALYIQDEYSYEDFQENKSRIYRVSQDLEMGGLLESAVSNIAAGPALAQEYPEIENFLRVIGSGHQNTVKVGDKVFHESGFWLVDSTFFEILSFRLLNGDYATALHNPKGVILTQSLATKFFGDKDPIGEQIKLNSTMVTVEGVVEDPPGNTEFQFKALRPISAIQPQSMEVFQQDWYRLMCYTYVLVTPQFNPIAMEAKLGDFYAKYIIPFQEANGVSGQFRYHFDPLAGLHFNNTKDYDLPRGNRNYIYIFGAVAIFILVIACINFINLSLAQNGRRAKEVGVRKTLGASKSLIVQQFLGESFLIALVALLVGLSLVELLLPAFNGLTGKSMGLGNLLSWQNLLILVIVYLVVGLLSGFYPAFVLGRLDPVRVLRGRSSKMGQHQTLRRVLVVVQFVFSLAMIASTAIVFQQFSFMKGKDLGFNKERVAVVTLPSDTTFVNHSKVFRNELAKVSGIEQVSNSGNFPGNNVGELFFRIEHDGQLVEKGIKYMAVDEHFLDLYKIELVDGRNFMREISSDDTAAFIINETAARQFGWAEKPIGKRMQWGLMANNTATNDGGVIGVVKDFNFQSLHNPIEPFVFTFNPKHTSLVSFRIAPGKIESVMENVEQIWNEFAGIYPLNYKFVDQQFDRLYRTEEQILTIFGYFAALSILISLLGLFAMSSFTIEQRIKEIGVRKVLGASVYQIIYLLLKDFMLLVAVAAVIAFPVSYYFLSDWLSGFAYRVPISGILFLLVLLLAFALTYIVVAFQGFKAARTNPVNALRFE